AVVFAAFPRVSRSWMTRTVTQTVSAVGFSDRVSIGEHGSRIVPNAEVVLRVEFPDGPPRDVRSLYWRGRSYDYFDGVAWSRSHGMPRTIATTGFYTARWPGARMAQRIFATPLDVPVIFGLHPVVFVQPHSRLRPLSDNAGDLWYYGTGAPSYTSISATESPTPEQLRTAYGEDVRGEQYYRQLPPLSDRIRLLADSLTRNQPTRYDSVLAVQQWLRSEFTYTLDLPATAREATLDYFLFRRRAGHCEYFSTALAVLLRSAGIPARNVNGFLGGRWNEFGQFLNVSQNEAHSWVEVWFPRYGWITFDATPAASTDAARQMESWISPLRTMLDGLEHRWNKWVLEYNLETQTALFRRAAAPFVRNEPGDAPAASRPALTRWLKNILLFSVIALAFLLLFSARRMRIRSSAQTRAYTRLRQGYEKAGYGVRAHDGPQALLAHLRRTEAPGLAYAERVIELYLRARFSGEEISEAEQTEMATSLTAALHALRGRRGGPSNRAAAA
ncbi:MAG TPA: DUF3488 and transglutaminase-like domain-containing protein, partial [Longimicrobiales bacterium]